MYFVCLFVCFQEVSGWVLKLSFFYIISFAVSSISSYIICSSWRSFRFFFVSLHWYQSVRFITIFPSTFFLSFLLTLYFGKMFKIHFYCFWRVNDDKMLKWDFIHFSLFLSIFLCLSRRPLSPSLTGIFCNFLSSCHFSLCAREWLARKRK